MNDRIVFIGSTRRGHQTLIALLNRGAFISGIVSMKQHPHESEQFMETFRSLARAHSIPLIEVGGFKDKSIAAKIQDWAPDLMIVVGCRSIIPAQVYSIPRLGTVAVHDSLIPLYRGFAPLNWVILNREAKTGVTLFYLNETMDGGDIVTQQQIAIGPEETATELYEKICDATQHIIETEYEKILTGKADRIRQDPDAGTFTCSRTPADGWIDWKEPTEKIYALIRALARPFPGAQTYFDGKRLTIWKAKPSDSASKYAGRIPGRVIKIDSETGGVTVLTGDGAIEVLEVEVGGEASTAATNVIRSVRASLGIQLYDLISRIELLEKRGTAQ